MKSVITSAMRVGASSIGNLAESAEFAHLYGGGNVVEEVAVAAVAAQHGRRASGNRECR